MRKDPKVLQQNLKDLMEKKGLTRERLASVMALDIEGRKWLARVLDDGLARTNKHTQERLCQLAKLVGTTVDRLWIPDSGLRQAELYGDLNHTLQILERDFRKVKIDEAAEDLLREIRRTLENWRRRADSLSRFADLLEKRDAGIEFEDDELTPTERIIFHH